jgi:N-acetylmuramate 1-kinase
MEPIPERKTMLMHWLKETCQLTIASMVPLRRDASFRHYYRVHTATMTYVVMDAPPIHEPCRPFVAIAQALRTHGLHTPEIVAMDLEQGFLLLSDLGDDLYLDQLNAANADQLYHRSLDALALLQTCSKIVDYTLPLFTAEWMWQEWAWFNQWVIERWLGCRPDPTLEVCFAFIVESVISQPTVFIHRDFHSANLMVLANDVGILDFQDACVGPVTYDLVSLLRDCYISWPEERVIGWVGSYQRRLQQLGQLTHITAAEFLRWFDLMGIERHLKALFTFARKYVRDHESRYLRHIPRTLRYLLQVSSAYPELARLHDYLRTVVQPAVKRAWPSCAP